ncbi:MAG: hypothetical protein QOK23_742, partial [Gammaproteobacteria bacterium]|nr:hypothetical protein [Gammaproteobacteria bacterium]
MPERLDQTKNQESGLDRKAVSPWRARRCARLLQLRRLPTAEKTHDAGMGGLFRSP